MRYNYNRFHNVESERSSVVSAAAMPSLLRDCPNLGKISYFGGRSAAQDVHRLALAALYESCPLLEDVELLALSSVTLNAALSATGTLINSDLSGPSIVGMESLRV